MEHIEHICKFEVVHTGIVARNGSAMKQYKNKEMMEKVIRCRDCSMCDKDEWVCCRDPNHTGRGRPVNQSGFCAWGKQKEGCGLELNNNS